MLVTRSNRVLSSLCPGRAIAAWVFLLEIPVNNAPNATEVLVKFVEYLPEQYAKSTQLDSLADDEMFAAHLEGYQRIEITSNERGPLCIFRYPLPDEEPIWLRVDFGHKKVIFGTRLSLRAAAWYYALGVYKSGLSVRDAPPELADKIVSLVHVHQANHTEALRNEQEKGDAYVAPSPSTVA